MKQIIGLFFKLVRAILTPPLLAWEWLATRNAPDINEETQAKIDDRTSNLSLYEFKTCPFCIKVRIHARRLGMRLRRLDAQYEGQARTDLESKGGNIQVPCLRINHEDGSETWLYESDVICTYLTECVEDL